MLGLGEGTTTTATTTTPSSWADKFGSWIGVAKQGADVYSQVKNSGSSSGSGGGYLPSAPIQTPQPTFMQKYGVALAVGGGAVALTTIIVLATRKKKK